MRFRPENGDVIFADSQGISRISVGDQQASIMTQWCSRSVYSVEGISPDGQYLALVSYGLQGYVILLNINAGQIIGVYPASYVSVMVLMRTMSPLTIPGINNIFSSGERAITQAPGLLLVPVPSYFSSGISATC